MEKEYIKAGKITSDIKKEAEKIVKDGLKVIDLVEFVENKIKDEGAGIAFPCNVSINEIAAHYTSPLGDTTVMNAGDIVKLDLGAEVNGYISDTAISILTPGDNLEEKYSEEEIEKREKIIEASEKGLESAISTVKAGVEIGKIGENIENTITDLGLKPISNLSGHQMDQWLLHSGVSIPNINDNNNRKLEEGDVLAIEPFATDGVGTVVDTPNYYIFKFMKNKPFRNTYTKRVLKRIQRDYNQLPFSQRWLNEYFEEKRLNFSMRQLSEAMAIYPYAVLREKTNCLISQTEHTVIVESDGCRVISE